MDPSEIPDIPEVASGIKGKEAHKLIRATKKIGQSLFNSDGMAIGEVIDIVVRWDGQDPHPLVTGLVASVGDLGKVFVSSARLVTFTKNNNVVAQREDGFQPWERRSGELLLNEDFIGRQVVDTDDVRVFRARDLFLARLAGQYRLVAVTGKKKYRLPEPGEEQENEGDLVDWADIHPFGDPGSELRLKFPHEGLKRLRPGDLADIIEHLDKEARDELTSTMDPEFVADAIEEMEPEEVEELLIDSDPSKAASLISKMEPDEAVDALRDLGRAEADEIIAKLPMSEARQINALLDYPEAMAGGFMTTTLVVAQLTDTVEEILERLKGFREHSVDIDGVVVVDEDGVFIDDLGLFDILVASRGDLVFDLVHEVEPVMVGADYMVKEVVDKLKESRRSSVIVVDEGRHPIGRVLADDVIDALGVGSGFRFRMPWNR